MRRPLALVAGILALGASSAFAADPCVGTRFLLKKAIATATSPATPENQRAAAQAAATRAQESYDACVAAALVAGPSRGGQ